MTAAMAEPPITLRGVYYRVVSAGLVEEAITQHIDPEALQLTRVAERSEREILAAMRVGGRP